MIPACESMHNFPLHPSCFATLPIIHSDQISKLFSLGGWLWKDHGWCDQLRTDEFQYSLKFLIDVLWHTFRSEHEITNKATFFAVCAVHGLPLHGCQSNRYLSYFGSFWRLCSFQVGLLFQNYFSNFCAFYPLSRYELFKLKCGLHWTACLQT